jgi:hypothetical protein
MRKVVAAALALAVPAGAAESVFFEALHGAPQPVAGGTLLGAPGRFVGHAVRTTGRLRAVDAGSFVFDLMLGQDRVRLRLEPEAKAVLVRRAAGWEGRAVEVDGLFFRDAGPNASAFVIRAWHVRALDEPASRAERPAAAAPLVSLEDLVYARGRYDTRLVRVRGAYRGPNRHRDLPEQTRRGGNDWVLKDGYFAAWVAGHEPRGEGWDAVEVLGVPATTGGVVRIAAREVDAAPALGGSAGAPLAAPRDTGAESVSPRVVFAYPVPGEPLRRAGHMLIQFSKPLDPGSLEGRVRVRYPGAASPVLRVLQEYRDRDRTLVVTPQPPPPAGAEVVVELLEGIIDVDGRALAPEPGEPPTAGGVVGRVRFRSAS